MELPKDLKYTNEHEWVRMEDDGTVTVGITFHAQDALGDIVYAETPKVGDTFAAGDVIGVVESVKAVSDIYSPLSGEIVAANETLENSPETVNESPFELGWFVRIKLSNPSELDGLLDVAAYAALTGH